MLTVAYQDGFDHYPTAVAAGTPLGIFQVWANYSSGAGPTPSFSTGYRGRGKRLELGKALLSDGRLIRAAPSDRKISVHVASSFTVIDTITGSRNWVSIHDSSMGEIFTIKTLPSQKLALFKGSSQLAESGPISTQVAHRFNLAADNTTTGSQSVQLWVDGDANKGFSWTGNNGIGINPMSICGLCQGGYGVATDGNNDHGFDDLVWCYGDNVNIGELELITSAPITDVQKQWTPLSGTDNFAMVDEIPPDTDTSYNSDTVVGNTDLQGFPALPTAADSIFCLTQIFAMKKEESGTRGFAPSFKGTGAQIDATTQNLSTSWDWYYNHYLKNPDTTAAWLASERTAGAFGYKDAI